jgi:hypothetical protein
VTNADLSHQPDRTVTVVTYDDHLTAQSAVDYLSDNKFPVGQVSIVGEDLRLVERVLGRWTVAKSAGAGALSGAWFGLLIGLLFGIFTTAHWLGVILAAVAIGAVWGAIFGAIAHGATGGRRDFQSVSSFVAARYRVEVPAEVAGQAQQLLAGFKAPAARA